MIRPLHVGCAVTVGLLLVTASGNQPLAAIVLALLLVGCTYVLVQLRMRTVRERAAVTHTFVTPMAVAWLLVTIPPTHSFAIRGNTEAVQSLGVESGVEFMYFCAIGAFAIAVIRSLAVSIDQARPPLALLALPVWSFLSFFWSGIALYTFARGIQMIVIGTLGWATIAIGRAMPSVLLLIIDRYLRWFVRITLVLIFLGFTLGPIYVPTGGSNLERFTWIGAHPNAAGLVLALTIVILVAAPASTLRMPTPVRIASLTTALVALYLNNSRTSLICTAGGLLIVLVIMAKRSPLVRFAVTPYVAASGLIAAMYFRSEILDYFYRGQDSETVSGGNGRRELWGDAYGLLKTAFDWMFGLGFGQARVVFLPERYWAKSAHSSILAMLVSLGIVGLVLFAVFIFSTAARILRSRMATTNAGPAVIGVFVVVLVNGIASDAVAEPNIGFSCVMFAGACAAGYEWHHRRGQPIDQPPDDAVDHEEIESGPPGQESSAIHGRGAITRLR